MSQRPYLLIVLLFLALAVPASPARADGEKVLSGPATGTVGVPVQLKVDPPIEAGENFYLITRFDGGYHYSYPRNLGNGMIEWKPQMAVTQTITLYSTTWTTQPFTITVAPPAVLPPDPKLVPGGVPYIEAPGLVEPAYYVHWHFRKGADQLFDTVRGSLRYTYDMGCGYTVEAFIELHGGFKWWQSPEVFYPCGQPSEVTVQIGATAATITLHGVNTGGREITATLQLYSYTESDHSAHAYQATVVGVFTDTVSFTVAPLHSDLSQYTARISTVTVLGAYPWYAGNTRFNWDPVEPVNLVFLFLPTVLS